MAIFTITNGESTELAVVKITPVIEDCFTLYEYIVTTNNGDNITIELSGNHYEAKYFNNTGTEVPFSDTINLVYNTYLKVRFLLLNSGVNSVYPNATINIKNTTLDKYYENFVERDNDGANCYDAKEYVESVTGVGVDNTDPLNPIVNIPTPVDYSNKLDSVVPGTNVTIDNTDINNPIINVPAQIDYSNKLDSIVAGTNVTIDNTDPNNPIISSTASGGGSITIDDTITDGSTNPVTNDAIYDALQLKANDSDVVHQTGNESNIEGIKTFISQTRVKYLEFEATNSSPGSSTTRAGLSLGVSGVWGFHVLNSSNKLSLNLSNLTSNKQLFVPDATGTIALISDIGTPNATHTGEVTGSTALTIANNAVTADKLATTGVTAGSYTSANITVNSKGQITAASSSTGSLPYLIYIARITQTGTAAPVVNVLQNTTSGITWTRDSTGVYRGAPVNLSEYNRLDTVGFAHAQNGLGPQYSIGLSFETASFIQLVSMTDGTATDSSLNGMIEIRFY